MSDVHLSPEDYFNAVGELRGRSAAGGWLPTSPDAQHGGATEALAYVFAVASNLDEAIREQRDVMANAFTLIGIDVMAADGGAAGSD